MNISTLLLVAISLIVTCNIVYGSRVLPGTHGVEATLEGKGEVAPSFPSGRQEGSSLESSENIPSVFVPVPEEEFEFNSEEEDDSENIRSKRFIIRIGGYPGYGGYGGYRGYRGSRRYRPHYHGYGRQYFNRW